MAEISQKIYQVIADSVVMTGKPDVAAEATTELLFGEHVEILEDDGEWIKGVCQTDGYEGYVPAGALDDEPSEATHKVSALRTFAFCEPDYKSPPLRALSFFSPLSTVLEDNGFFLLEQGGWVYGEHITDISDHGSEPIETALQFLGAPYLWGGRTSLGLDCSALVQLCLKDAGHSCPRDTKDQINTIGQEVSRDSLQKGDLVFFEGHVGIMINDNEILNATARHMKVCVENIDTVEKFYDGILAIKRL